MRPGEFAAGQQLSPPASNATRVPRLPPGKSGFLQSSRWRRSALRERSPMDRLRHLPTSPSCCSTALPTNLKREIAVGRMGIHREDMPIDAVGSCTAGTYRYRHLVATDTCLAGIDALTGGVGHGDGAKSRFEFFG